MFGILRIEILVDRPELQATQPQVLDAVLQLLDAGRVVGIDRAPADEAVGVLADESGDGFLRAADSGEWRLDGKDDHLVAAPGRGKELFRPAVEIVLPARVIDGTVDVGREAHLRSLGGPGRLDKLLREVVRIPEQVRVDVNEHKGFPVVSALNCLTPLSPNVQTGERGKRASVTAGRARRGSRGCSASPCRQTAPARGTPSPGRPRSRVAAGPSRRAQRP